MEIGRLAGWWHGRAVGEEGDGERMEEDECRDDDGEEEEPEEEAVHHFRHLPPLAREPLLSRLLVALLRVADVIVALQRQLTPEMRVLRVVDVVVARDPVDVAQELWRHEATQLARATLGRLDVGARHARVLVHAEQARDVAEDDLLQTQRHRLVGDVMQVEDADGEHHRHRRYSHCAGEVDACKSIQHKPGICWSELRGSDAPRMGMLSEVLGTLSVTLRRKIWKESRLTTPIWTFCAGVQKKMESSRTARRSDVRKERTVH